ncbi:MAG: methyltransferase domain-containing protein, partial [Planctomycetes bacterium]|nr:methyltransferase domain-containing protein [Planctomycetota bacterium]
NVVAVDISPILLEQAAAKEIAGKVAFRIDDAEQLSFDDSSFDAVAGSSILHHLDVQAAAGEICRVLRPGGRMAFAEPNMMNPHIVFERSTPAVRRWMGVSPEETAFFRWRLAKLLRTAGFSNIRVNPYDFLPPAVPGALVPLVRGLGDILERLPLVREIAGSLIISAQRP